MKRSELGDNVEHPASQKKHKTLGDEESKQSQSSASSIVQPGGGDLPEPVNRERTVPFLVRVFCNNSHHHSRPETFDLRWSGANHLNELNKLPAAAGDRGREFHMYFWRDTTLEEVMARVQQVFEPARQVDKKLSFKRVFYDRQLGRYDMKIWGSLPVDKSCWDDFYWDIARRNLSQVEIGFFLDVALYRK